MNLSPPRHISTQLCVGSVRRRTDATAYVGQARAMDWIAASAEWRHFKHAVRAEWKCLTNAQLDVISGVRARLGEQICSSYEVTAEEAERQICYFEARSEYFLPVSSC
jgi:predicted NUDIX family NTP pyrophosphohydrolase